MSADHRRIELLCREVVALCAEDDPDLRAAWGLLESSLHRHLAAEEAYVLPLYARSHPEGARELLRAHEHLRAELLEIGVQLDLHAVTTSRMSAFIASLQAHAEQEDRDLYQWIAHLPRDRREALRAWIEMPTEFPRSCGSQHTDDSSQGASCHSTR